jgi:hypothetical protein
LFIIENCAAPADADTTDERLPPTEKELSANGWVDQYRTPVRRTQRPLRASFRPSGRRRQGGMTMPASIQSSRELLITFERDGTVTDRQVSTGGFDAVTTALTMIGQYDELQPGDRLTVEKSEGISIVPPIDPSADTAAGGGI